MASSVPSSQHHEAIGRAHALAFRQDEQRVDLGLDQPVAQGQRHVGERQDGGDQRFEIASGTAAEALEQRRRSSARPPSRRHRSRPSGGRRIAVSLNSSVVTPPMPSRMAGPSWGSRWKPRISSAPPWTISWTRKPFDLLGCVARLDRGCPSRRQRPATSSGFTLTSDAADLRLVGMCAREDLQDDRAAELLRGRLPASAGVATAISLGDGDAEAREQRLALRLVERSGGKIADLVTGAAAGGRRSGGVLGAIRQPDAQHRRQRGGAALGCGEGGNAAAGSDGGRCPALPG